MYINFILIYFDFLMHIAPSICSTYSVLKLAFSARLTLLNLVGKTYLFNKHNFLFFGNFTSCTPIPLISQFLSIYSLPFQYHPKRK